MKYVADTSSIINGNVSALIKEGKIKGTLIIPEFVTSELENQANRGREIGFEGLDELKNIRELCKKHKIELSQAGRKPTIEEIQLAKSGRIDSLIRDIARENKAKLITADIVQAKSAEAIGIQAIYFKREEIKELAFEKYFSPDTMSVHLKEGVVPKAKVGKPGKAVLKSLSKSVSTKECLETISREIADLVRTHDDAFMEMGHRAAQVIQYKKYRIAIARPPFASATEITIVRPTIKVDLDHYKLSAQLKERLEKSAEGIILAGPPGHGKTTLAQAMAEFYQKKGKIVKTMEQPRDLQVGPEITQYGALSGDMAKTADMLLLVRPDFTIYDELRKTSDFKIFSDMRLAGVGLLGIVHATQPIDAVHRFITRIELGMIPQVIDTIIFVHEGAIKKVYTLRLIVRTPNGMTEADLARPLVEVIDFETGTLEYEIYTYGEQTVVMPVKTEAHSAMKELAESRIKQILGKYIDNPVVEVVSDNKAILKVQEEDIARIIGKGGKTISELEKKAGIHISVEPVVETLKKEISFEVSEAGGYLAISVGNENIYKDVDVYRGEDYVLSATVGKKSTIKVKKNSQFGKEILKAAKLGNLRVLAG